MGQEGSPSHRQSARDRAGLPPRHATCDDADHVIAVSTIVSRQRSAWGAALIGSLWGIGHTVTIMVVGGVIILFDVVIPPRLGLAMEFSVALMLILLGLASLFGFTTRVTTALTGNHHQDRGAHAHPHAHSDYVHTHPHEHQPDSHGHEEAQTPLSRIDRALGGSALPGRAPPRGRPRPRARRVGGGRAPGPATIRDPLWAVAYLFLFGLGTVVGMMVVTAVIALPFAYSAGRFAIVNRYLGLAAGLLSLGVGLFLAYQIGLVDGLFTGDPQWTPK